MESKKYHPQKWFLVTGIIFLISVTICADSIPGVPVLYEKNNNWCWAAATECIVKYYIPDLNKTQKQIASVLTTQNIAPPPEDIVKCLEENGKDVNLQAEMIERPLTWEEIKLEADEERPFIMLIRWNSGGYHANVNAGYIRDSTKIKWMEPIQKPGRMTYRSYKGSLKIGDRGKWERSYTTKIGTSIKKNTFSGNKNSNFFKIVRNDMQSPGAGITLLFNDHVQRSGTVNIYNASGVCLYRTELRGNTNRLSWTFPNSMATGLYYVSTGVQRMPLYIVK